jgi:hypothetical protein
LGSVDMGSPKGEQHRIHFSADRVMVRVQGSQHVVVQRSWARVPPDVRGPVPAIHAPAVPCKVRERPWVRGAGLGILSPGESGAV